MRRRRNVWRVRSNDAIGARIMMKESTESIEDQLRIKQTDWAQADFKRCKALVAFVDILGFSRIGCRDDNPKIDSRLVALQDLYKSGEVIFTKIENRHLQSVDRPERGMEVGLSPGQFLEVYLISDSLVLVCPLADENDCPLSEQERAKIDVMFEFCHELNQSMFEKGLPLRGAIAYGDVYKPEQRTCCDLNGVALLGGALIEAHDFGESIDAAAIAVCSSAEEYLLHAGIDLDSLAGVTSKKIRLPLKNGYRCIRTNVQPSDVEKCFSGYGKSIDGVRSKIENTIQILKASQS